VSGTQGRAAIDEQASNIRSAKLLPAVELPASVEELAAGAAARLGWHGTVLPPMTLLGRRVVVVADLLTDAHAERICLGCPPVPDRATVATWVWPELAARVPAPAVRIVGVLAVARHWRTGLVATVPFTRYAETAIVLPWWAATTHDYLVNCLPRARRHGVGVLTADPEGVTDIDLPGATECTAVDLDATGRWLNEAVYERLSTVAE
jgi:hypothetical protein